MGHAIGDILDEVERGRLAPDHAVRLLLAPPAAAPRQGMRWLRVEFGADRPVRFRLPFAPVAMLLAGMEVAVYPVILLASRLAASRVGDPRVRRLLSDLPALPLGRTLVALLKSRAPFCVAVRDGGRQFRIAVD